ncbi:MAG: hypothetical protein J6Q40_06760 [Tidjanibacter sp.]|nr:hypothetical protein [Tidjanibacter sp.]
MKSTKFNSGKMVNIVLGTMVVLMVIIWCLNRMRPEWYHNLMWIAPLCFALSGRMAVMMCEKLFALPAGKVINKMLLFKMVKLLGTMVVMITCFLCMEATPARNAFLIVLVGGYLISTVAELKVFSHFEKVNKARAALKAAEAAEQEAK